ASGASTRPRLLGVTVLTSLDAADLAATGVTAPLADHALELGRLSLAAGLDGLVCSAQELTGLRRAFGSGPKLIVPGIRPAGAGDDQKRTMSPAEALALGADVLVIGRPITRADSPVASAAAIAGQLREAA
ncbi:MAG TPA: orotidine 5'-phosphate decarboxylase / HUMPS family protein, partial [Geminicoccaceae bacterium]|nr:orotidine 5'-phosphate decarboxylase / HUMPS family protein [Geminicoccaceae bacterium]